MTLPALLPQPKRIQLHTGFAALDGRSHVLLASGDERLQRAVRRWQEAFPDPADTQSHPATVRIAVEKSTHDKTDGYRLTVTPDAIAILAPRPAGCFHALQTLEQLRGGGSRVPCCDITDWPDFQTRGLLHDVSRGKVPTLETLKLLADRLASWKVNQLQLYIEHAFTFEFDSDICGPDDGLTPDEIRELDEYCRERFIDLVPAVATLGHMGRILSMPKYRHLAEIEPTRTWSELDWPARARGFTLDIANPKSWELVRSIWSEILGAFSGPVVNICGDEPWDLGKGKNRERFASGIARPYIDHILRTYELCASQGRDVQVWSDVICKHPEQFGRLPKHLTVLHWGYDDRADYEGTAAFPRAGLETFVCPGVSGWKRILPALSAAERNIARFAAAGKQHGTKGLLNTDWGDHGHVHSLASSWHGLALGAALAWSADHPTGREFDALFGTQMLGTDGGELATLLRGAADLPQAAESWRLFWQPLALAATDPTWPSADAIAVVADAAYEAEKLLQRMFHNPAAAIRQDLAELRVGLEMTRLFAERVRFDRGVPPGGIIAQAFDGDLEVWGLEWGKRLKIVGEKFADCWLARNKPSGLMDIRGALAAAGDDVRTRALAG